jgi:hypothetical protein
MMGGMASSIEFGILRERSTVSLLPNFRVDIGEEDFQFLLPILERVRRRTGIVFDLYSSAEISGTNLDVFIDVIERCEHTKQSPSNELLMRLLLAARHAKVTNKPLQYRGL